LDGDNKLPNYDLFNKSAIITGASRGLGAAIAKMIWMAGANLMLVDKEQVALNEVISSLEYRLKQNKNPLYIDLCAPDATDLILKSAKEFFDHLDILVNNAAIQGPVGPSWENDWDFWKMTLNIDLLAPFDLSRCCAAWMIHQSRGKIICLSGGVATSSRPNFSAYWLEPDYLFQMVS
jgi:3-oxoacyl-[acyl-carrier protein] reductase